MDGAAAIPSHPTATAAAAATAAPDSPNVSTSLAWSAGVSETRTTQTASRALSTPTASGPSPNRLLTNAAASTRGVSSDVTNNIRASRSPSMSFASERNETGCFTVSARFVFVLGFCCAASISGDVNATAASAAAASSHSAAARHAPRTSTLVSRTIAAAATRAKAHAVVNSEKSRVRCAWSAAMSVARAVRRPPLATQPVSRRQARTAA
mmetsp:Transcript_27964/g.94150  ORF Transcript_27964/g.94150 Transcript_27964/m.94150 type:complete len:210 (-) Transcript_27964:513-1142(-)